MSYLADTLLRMTSQLLNLLCRNSLHPWMGPGPCPDCRENPDEGVVLLGVAESRRLFREINPDLQQCPKCGEVKPRTAEFFHQTSKGSGGLVNQCKTCVNKYNKAWRNERLSDGTGKNHYRRRLLRSYNLPFDAFCAMLESQGGCCAICGSPEPQGADWAIDHDHRCCPTAKRSCGRCVRGLLCVRCNVGLSYFRDNPNALIAAGEYVIEHQQRIAR